MNWPKCVLDVCAVQRGDGDGGDDSAMLVGGDPSFTIVGNVKKTIPLTIGTIDTN